MEPATHQPDSDLIRAYADTRSEQAFSLLVHRYINLVYATAVRRCGNPHLAEDVTQAVFFVLAKKANRLANGTVLSGWLHQTARFIAADAIKLDRRRQHHERIAAAMRPSMDNATSETNDILLHLETAIDRLPAADRNAILLRYFQGLSVIEVGRELKLNSNTAAKRMGRAIDRLRSNLAELGGPAAFEEALRDRATQQAPAELLALCMQPAAATAAVPLSLASRAMRIRWIVPLSSAAAGLVLVVGLAGIAKWIFSPPPPLTSVSVVTAPLVVLATAPPTTPDAAAQLQIRAAISMLRHCSPTAQTTEWITAMRTLVQIGSPAVPELIAELDRANRHTELRSMGFTLRAIKDPLAVPALIRALRRIQNSGPSGYGFEVEDPGLAAFFRSHEFYRDNSEILSVDSSTGEILSALKSITQHSEGAEFQFKNGAITDAELEASRKRQTQLADAWQKWWDANHAKLVSDAQLARLNAEPHTLDAVESAGEAVNGPLFPTGKPYHLGPVHDEHLRVFGDGLDQDMVVCFDCQQELTLLECMMHLQAGEQVCADRLRFNSPLAGITGCQHSQYTTNWPVHGAVGSYTPPPGEVKDFYMLSPPRMATWPTDNQTWDTLGATIAAGTPIPLDPDGPQADFGTVHDKSVGRELPFPVTFLFRTQNGGAGIIQLLESDVAHQCVHFQYRMVEPSPRPIPPLPPVITPTGSSFSEIREFTLAGPKPNSPCGFDLSNEKLVDAPDSPESVEKPLGWMKDQNADLVSVNFWKSDKLDGVRFRDTARVDLSSKQFDDISPDTAACVLGHSAIGQWMLLSQSGQRDLNERVTALFRTSEGVEGIIQIVEVVDNPPSVRLRYKLLERS